MRRKSARREKRHKKNLKGQYLPFVKIGLWILVLLIGFSFLFFSTKYWDGVNKFSVVTQEPGGDVKVTILDPKLTEITILTIPGDTQVSVSHNLGNFPLKSVWQIGVNEDLGGSLLTDTIRKNFTFPVFLWAGADVDKLNFIFSAGKNNLPIGDRIKMYLFARKVPALSISEIDLGESGYLKSKKLTDGTLGHVISGDISSRLAAFFVDNEINQLQTKIYIKDETGSFGVSEDFGKVLEVLGGKVITIDKEAAVGDFDCLVSGKDPKTLTKMKQMFGCSIEKSETSFDIEFKLGKSFFNRY